MKQLIPLTLIIMAVFSASIFAQFEIGASYELRDEDPKNGFGLRVQKGFLESVPMVSLGLRAHFSYFNEENKVNGGDISFSRTLTNYDFGISAIGGVSVGLLEPYVGLGLGSETTDFDRSDLPQNESKESNLYWNLSAGAKVTVIPLIKPFVEYRYSDKELGNPKLADAQNRRIMFGVMLSF